MRLWSIHPRYLDARGLVALWREALLARRVLEGKTRGYRRHPQLERFRSSGAPLAAVDQYLRAVYEESVARGYRFDRGKLGRASRVRVSIPVTTGQLRYEMAHLKRKLSRRDPGRNKRISKVEAPVPHPLFTVRRGAVASWERGAP